MEANEGITVIPSFGILACRNRKVTMSVLIDPVVNLDFYQICNRGSRLFINFHNWAMFYRCALPAVLMALSSDPAGRTSVTAVKSSFLHGLRRCNKS